MPYDGECNCGGIKVSITDKAAAENQPIFCRCLTCRRQSGALGTYVMVVPEEEVNITGPLKAYLDNKTDSGTPLQRWFCEVCGCPVISTTPLYAGKKIVKLGLFDKIEKPVAEVYCKNRQAWEPQLEGVAVIQGAA